MTRLIGLDPSGSSLDRVSLCAASAALPQIIDANDTDEQMSAKKRGTAIHAFLDNVAKLGRAAALELCDPTWRERCESIDVAKLADVLKFSTEVAIAYNWRDDTARMLYPKAPRVYEIDLDSEIAGTIDVAAYDPKASRVYSGDFKGPRAWLPAPEASMQLGLGALALARIHGADSAEVEYMRVLDDGNTRRMRASLDVFALEGAADRIRRTMGLVEETRAIVDAGKSPNVTEGPWCRYCPARLHCPAKTAGMLAALTGPVAMVLGEDVAPDATLSLRDGTTPAQAAQVYEKLRRAKDLLAQMEGVIYAYAKLTPIPVRAEDDGSQRFFGELRRPGNDVLDGAIVHRVVTAKYGAEAANSVVTMETTKKAIGELIKARKPSDEIAKATKWTQVGAIREIIEAVEKLGGISNPETCTTTEYTLSAQGEAKARKRSAA